MVIDSQGNQRGIMDVEAAIRMAQESNLDLVQISDGKDRQDFQSKALSLYTQLAEDLPKFEYNHKINKLDGSK